MRLSANNTPFDKARIEGLVADKWDLTALHVLAICPNGSEKLICGSTRIAKADANRHLPLSELYSLRCSEHDVEIGKTTVLPASRGGFVASLLLTCAISHVEQRMPHTEHIYADPLIGTQRGISLSTLQEMGFRIAAEPVLDPRYDLWGQAVVLERKRFIDFWDWRDRRYSNASAPIA